MLVYLGVPYVFISNRRVQLMDGFSAFIWFGLLIMISILLFMLCFFVELYYVHTTAEKWVSELWFKHEGFVCEWSELTYIGSFWKVLFREHF